MSTSNEENRFPHSFPSHERHYNLYQVAKRYNISYWTAREMFKDYPGVKKIGRKKPGKQPHYTYRIPESVLKRKDDEMTNGGVS